MSHFIHLKTQIREKSLLERALRDLNLQYRAAQGNVLPVRGYRDNREQAEIVVDTHSQYDIGFQRQQDGYEIVADWWGVQKDTPLRQESFCQQINRQYAYTVLKEQAREQNLVWEEERPLENGDLVILLSERG